MSNLKIFLAEESSNFSLDALYQIAASQHISAKTLDSAEEFAKIITDNNDECVVVVKRASDTTAKVAPSKELELKIEERLQKILIMVGIPSHIKGSKFLRDAIKASIGNPEMINNITKKLYPRIAELNNTSASKVERAIRHAIEVSWSRGKIDNINNIFGLKVFAKGEKPTNGELIALLADKILLEISA